MNTLFFTDRQRRIAFSYAFLTPLLVIYILLMIYPLVRGAIWSLQDLSLAAMAGGQDISFVGLENYRDLLADTTFWRKIVPNTVFFVAGSVVLQIALGIGLALLLNQDFIVGKRLIRSLVLLPWVTANVVVAYSWVFIYDSRLGLANQVLLGLGLDPVSWLADRTIVMPAIILANVWRGTAFAMLIHTSGLQSISEDLFEAAAIDGASPWQMIRRITIPLLRPFTLLNLLYATMATLNVFDLIFVMTGGGPLNNSSVASLYMYDISFTQGRFGYGAAISMFLLLVNIVMTYFFVRWSGEDV
ncbi:MAG: sugar ABC transporter permease [Chloroflexota bacterium]